MNKMKDASAIYEALIENNVINDESLTEEDLHLLLETLFELISINLNEIN